MSQAASPYVMVHAMERAMDHFSAIGQLGSPWTLLLSLNPVMLKVRFVVCLRACGENSLPAVSL